MNLRGLSYWMLPSQPVSRRGYSRLAKVRSQQLVPGGASISLVCFTSDGSGYFMSRLVPSPTPRVCLNPSPR